MEQLDGVMSQYNLQPLVGLIDPRMLYGFTMLYQTRNYRVAAVQLHQSLTSLSRNIKALETLLGVKLFQRTTRQVVPTQLADELYERLQKPLNDLSDALLGAQEATEQVKGRVRLTTTSMIAEMMLPKVLQALSTQYPQVRLELVLDEKITDLRARSIDIAIRAGQVKDESLVGHELTRHIFYEYCAAKWAGQTNVPRLAYFDESELAQSILVSSNMRLNYLAVCAGVGRAVLPEALCEADERQGTLIKYRPEVLGDYPIYLLYPSREHLPRCVQVVLQLIRLSQSA